MIVARILRDGRFDPSWSENGGVTTRLAEGAHAFDLALQSDGKALVVGGAGQAEQWAFALARYLS
jgi:hypothetical protein